MADYNIEQIETLTGFSRRTIRYYIQKGLVEAPFGARKTPSYTERHVEQLLQIKKFKESGLNLSRIAKLLEQPEIGAYASTPEIDDIQMVQRVKLSDGVALDIDTQRVTLSQAQIRELRKLLTDFINGQEKES